MAPAPAPVYAAPAPAPVYVPEQIIPAGGGAGVPAFTPEAPALAPAPPVGYPSPTYAPAGGAEMSPAPAPVEKSPDKSMMWALLAAAGVGLLFLTQRKRA